ARSRWHSRQSAARHSRRSPPARDWPASAGRNRPSPRGPALRPCRPAGPRRKPGSRPCLRVRRRRRARSRSRRLRGCATHSPPGPCSGCRPPGSSHPCAPLPDPEPLLDQRIAVFVDWIPQHPAERHTEGVAEAFEGSHRLLGAGVFKAFRAPILFFSLLEKLGGGPPGEGHVRLLRRAPVELDLSPIEVDGPGESPVLEYP